MDTPPPDVESSPAVVTTPPAEKPTETQPAPTTGPDGAVAQPQAATPKDSSKWASRKLLVLLGCFAACFANAFLENPIDPDVLNTLLYTTIGYLVSQGYVDAKGLDKGMLGAVGAFAANSGKSSGEAYRGESSKAIKP